MQHTFLLAVGCNVKIMEYPNIRLFPKLLSAKVTQGYTVCAHVLHYMNESMNKTITQPLIIPMIVIV